MIDYHFTDGFGEGKKPRNDGRREEVARQDNYGKSAFINMPASA
jgi:hypothetical protein